MFNLPGIVYHVRNGSMDVFAFKGKRPVETTPAVPCPVLQRDRIKCLPWQQLSGKATDPTFLSLLEYWENGSG